MGLSNRRTLKLKPGVVPSIKTADVTNEKFTPNVNSPPIYSDGKNYRLTETEQVMENEDSPQDIIKLENYEIVTCGELNVPMLADVKENNQQQNIVIKMEDDETPQQTIKLESSEMLASNDSNTTMSMELNAINSQVKNEVNLANEDEPQQKLKLKMSETPSCANLHTPNSPDFNEGGLLLYAKTLENKIEALRQENAELRCHSAYKLQHLSRQVQVLSYKNENLEKALKRLFTEGQIRNLRNRGKRQVYADEDIAESINLYTTSPKAYMLLKKKHFPFPSVRTIQKWLQKKNLPIDKICDPSTTKSHTDCCDQNP